MTIPTLDMPSPFLSRHQITLLTFLRIMSFHTIVKKHIKIVGLHIRLKEHLKIILPTTGTVAIFKK
jgi:hypothetical protein